MTKSMTKVGIFDSGIGGLSVAKSVLEARMFAQAVYYGDTARVPYGVKDRDTIVRFALECLEFFAPHNIDMLLVACNTVSAYALETMQKKASFPIVGVIEAGVKACINALDDKDSPTLIIGTKATIDSKQYEKRLREAGYTRFVSKDTGLFVPLVEEGLYRGKGEVVLDSLLHFYLDEFLDSPALGRVKPQAVILGCTHFPLISKQIGEFFGGESVLIHSGEAIVELLESNFNLRRNGFESTHIDFYASSDIDGLKSKAKIWLQ